MQRRGLGIGLGKGYYNLVPKDPYIHSLSAKGVKTKLDYLKKINLQKKKLNEYDFIRESNYYPKYVNPPLNDKVIYHQGIFQNEFNPDNPLPLTLEQKKRYLKVIDKIKTEIFDLLYNVKYYKGQKAIKNEVLTIIVLKDKAHHFDFLKSNTKLDAEGSWTANIYPLRIQNYDNEKNTIIEVQFLDTKDDLIGKRLLKLFNKLNRLEIGEWLLYVRTSPLSEENLLLSQGREKILNAKKLNLSLYTKNNFNIDTKNLFNSKGKDGYEGVYNIMFNPKTKELILGGRVSHQDILRERDRYYNEKSNYNEWVRAKYDKDKNALYVRHYFNPKSKFAEFTSKDFNISEKTQKRFIEYIKKYLPKDTKIFYNMTNEKLRQEGYINF